MLSATRPQHEASERTATFSSRLSHMLQWQCLLDVHAYVHVHYYIVPFRIYICICMYIFEVVTTIQSQKAKVEKHVSVTVFYL